MLQPTHKHSATHKKQPNPSKRIEAIRQRFATARFGKTERTNSFLKDPIAFAANGHEEHEEPDPPEVEPWLQEYEDTE
jgi:hypothetical protein